MSAVPPLSPEVDDIAYASDKPKGVTAPTDRQRSRSFLSDVIVEMGLLDRDTVDRAVDTAGLEGRPVPRVLLESGALNHDQISRAIAERHGLDHVDLGEFDLDQGAAGLISYTAALRYHAVPIAFTADGALIVALADPVDALAVSDIAAMTKNEIRVVVASEVAIEAVIDRLREVDESRAAANPRHATALAPANPSPSSSEPAEEPAAAAAAIEPTAADEPGVPVEHAEAASAELEAGRDRLREELDGAKAERDRLRRELKQIIAERDRMHEENAELRDSCRELEAAAAAGEEIRARLETLADELGSARERAVEAQHSAERNAQRIGELEDADRRAETARLANAELREERDREREHSARLERKLHEELSAVSKQRDELADRLAKLRNAAAEAREAAERLAAFQRELGAADSEDDSDDLPPTEAFAPPDSEDGVDRENGNGCADSVADSSDDPPRKVERLDF